MKHLKSVLPRSKALTKKYISAISVWAILFLLCSGTKPEGVQPHPKDVTKARNETLKAFLLISTHLDKGLERMEYLKEFETARRKITKL